MKGLYLAYTRMDARLMRREKTIWLPVPGLKKIRPPVRNSLRTVSMTSK